MQHWKTNEVQPCRIPTVSRLHGPSKPICFDAHRKGRFSCWIYRSSTDTCRHVSPPNSNFRYGNFVSLLPSSAPHKLLWKISRNLGKTGDAASNSPLQSATMSSSKHVRARNWLPSSTATRTPSSQYGLFPSGFGTLWPRLAVTSTSVSFVLRILRFLAVIHKSVLQCQIAHQMCPWAKLFSHHSHLTIFLQTQTRS